MRIVELKPTIDWLVKVVNSCETEPQIKSAVRLVKHYVSVQGDKIDVFDTKGWDNFKLVCNELIAACKGKKKEIKNRLT